MDNINFDKLVSVQAIDTWTAEILWQYYIEWKYTDFKLFCIWTIIVLLLFFFIWIFDHKKW